MMKKIPTIFERDFDGDPSRVLNIPNPECDWVFAGEGRATRKYDGTSCMFDGEVWWKRREVKKGKSAPPVFLEMSRDETTGKVTGWVPVEPSDRWHLDGIKNSNVSARGTFELCGPKVQGNPEGFDIHVMVNHSTTDEYEVYRTFDCIREWLVEHNFEGLVFQHKDGRMAKIKRRDFGLTSHP